MLFSWGDTNGWKNNIAGLEILVRAVANSSLKHSLKQIKITEENMDSAYEKEVWEIFDEHNLQDILYLIG